jgi:threonine/homoserine efflux transporter RhtA
MRAFWLTLLLAGLVLVTVDTYEASQTDATGAVPAFADDGTGFPAPAPSPTPVTK